MRLLYVFRLFCAVIFLLSLGHEARAEYQGLLLLGNPFQVVKLDYEFRDTRTNNGHSTTTTDQNRFYETYSISLPFAVLSQNIFDGNVIVSARSRQDYISTSYGMSRTNTTNDINYSLSGAVTKKKKFSLYVHASSNFEWVQQEFSPGYDRTANSYGATAYYKSSIIPLRAKFTHDDSDLNGSNIDQYNSVDVFSLNASNQWRRAVQTNLGISYSMIRNRNGLSPDQSLDTLNIDFSNSISWRLSPTTPGYLSSGYNYSRSTGISQLDSYLLRETILQSFGRALTTGASYSYSSQQNPSYSVNTSTGHIWLNHKLFDSLRTDLNAQGVFTEVPTGEHNQLGGSAALSYQKRLPVNSSLSLSVSESYQWDQQKSTDSLRTQFDESITITNIAINYRLNNPNVIDIQGIWKDVAHTVPYARTADWDTQTIGNFTYLTINPAGQIHTGDTIFVTYTYQTDTELTFGSTTFSLSGNYSFSGNLLRLYSLYTVTDQKLLVGSANYAVLGQRTNLTVGAESHFLYNTAGIRYDTSDDDRTRQYGLTEYWTYARDIGLNLFNLSVSDTYSSWNDKSLDRDSWSNSINAAATLSRDFTRTSRGTIRAGYLLVDGTTSREAVYGSLDYGITLGKLRFLLRYQSIYNDSRDSGQSTLNNIIHLTVARYFY